MQHITQAVEKHRALILEAERYIWQHPETGYKEHKTSAYLAEKFEALGYKLTYAEGITGFVTELDTGREGPTLLILGELDSIICPSHPESDPETGAVHSCGHNAQCAALLGIAAALTEEGMLDALSGKIRLCAVPAEELLEIEFRSKLRAEGKIKYMGGKSEFLSRGLFDGVDLAFLFHTGPVSYVQDGAVGCIAKKIIYKGRASHAAVPWNGHNALYAANCGLNAINAIRETFQDSNLIRVHPIITHGGDMVNAIPERVELESYVRGKTFAAINDANKRVNRALTGAALSLDTNVEIVDIPGYAPLYNAAGMTDACLEAAAAILPGHTVEYKSFGNGSTDMGDLCCIMPVIHPHVAGSAGIGHGNNYQIVDPEMACVNSAKWQLAMAKLLLENGATRAKQIVAEFQPQFASAKEYLAYMDSLNDQGDRITYRDNGTADVRFE